MRARTLSPGLRLVIARALPCGSTRKKVTTGGKIKKIEKIEEGKTFYEVSGRKGSAPITLKLSDAACTMPRRPNRSQDRVAWPRR
jgi:hypothetical protein